MSLHLAKLRAADSRKIMKREQILALEEPRVYDDGRTKQSFEAETNIQKIMARADKLGTISHLQKYEGVYADYSDFNFHEQTEKLTQGRMIFDDLPAEVRKEFGQSPAAFFAYVNDPANKDDLLKKLPYLAKPGTQLKAPAKADADTEAAQAAADKPAETQATNTADKPAETEPDVTPDV